MIRNMTEMDIPVVIKEWNDNMNFVKYVPGPYLDCSAPVEGAISKTNKKKKGNTMCYDCECAPMERSLDQQRLDHLQSRLYAVTDKKDRDLQRAYGLRDNEPPTTLADLFKRIEEKKYVVDEDKLGKTQYYFGDLLRWIRWRDPAVKPDQVGYDKVWEEVQKERDATLDVIMVSDAKAGLEALQAFEAKTFT